MGRARKPDKQVQYSTSRGRSLPVALTLRTRKTFLKYSRYCISQGREGGFRTPLRPAAEDEEAKMSAAYRYMHVWTLEANVHTVLEYTVNQQLPPA